MAQFMARSGLIRISLVLILLLGVVGGATLFFLSGEHPFSTAKAGTETARPEGETEVAISVKTVHPRYDQSFTMTARRPADVEAYYWADLESRVPGVVSMIRTAIGDVVKKGETLVAVDVPDLKAKVEQQTAAVSLANAQVDQKKAALDSARTELKVIEAKINAAVAKLNSDKAYYKFRVKQADRFRELLAQRSIDARLVDEQEDRREAAFEAVNASTEAVNEAKSRKEEVLAKIKQAEADLEEARQRVKVAKSELDYAQAMLDFSTIEAPFDGVVVRRMVDPGSFVQNAATGHPTPLLSMQRSDIVTVVMRLPDRFAPYITTNTEAIIELDSLPGLQIHGKVTRFAKSLINNEHDLTMRVEVDLWNGTRDEFNAFKKNEEAKKTPYDDLKKGPLPIVPEFKGIKSSKQKPSLLPGMFGHMTLVLRQFENVHMLPTSAIVSQGGNAYIYVVQDGKAHLQPVKVQVDDGKLVKLELLGKDGEVVGDLTGQEEVIISNQSELSEGQLVQPTLVQNWGAVANVKKTEH